MNALSIAFAFPFFSIDTISARGPEPSPSPSATIPGRIRRTEVTLNFLKPGLFFYGYMSILNSEGTPCKRLWCEHGVYRDLPLDDFLCVYNEKLQYSSKQKYHNRKINRLITRRKPEETSEAIGGAGPTTGGQAVSTGKESILIGHCLKCTNKLYKGHMIEKLYPELVSKTRECTTFKEEVPLKTCTTYRRAGSVTSPANPEYENEYMNMKCESYDNDNDDNKYDHMRKRRRDNGMTFEERIDKILEKKCKTLTRQAERLAAEKNGENRGEKTRICRKYILRLAKKKDGTKNKTRTKQGEKRDQKK